MSIVGLSALGKSASLIEHQNLVESTIADLQNALSSGSLTSVELVAKYLHRVATYDCRGPCLNSIPILNLDVFDQAKASDDRRAAGKLLGPLDGIPYTLKDSMKYKGMTCSAGSPALENLIANEDSFVAEQLRNAGAVCVGRTNTPPMMASGMHRGVLGRAESPYNLEYLPAAFSSGSSNGSGTATAASFAAFGLGSETVSSGRSPASNNGLIAYTPSRTMISPRGVWPLYPTCDVIVPHTRTVEDMLAILDILTIVDPRQDGDFWREQTFVKIPSIARPHSFLDLKGTARGSLKGKRIAAPRMYIGGYDSNAKPTVVSQDVIRLWKAAQQDLEALGATIVETDFPLVTKYEDDSITGQVNNVVGAPPEWNRKERGELVAYSWDDFLKANADPNYPDLGSVDGKNMFPRPEGYIPDRYMEHKNFLDYPGLVQLACRRSGESVWDIDGIAQAVQALEAQRKRDFEDWMDEHRIDIVVFPANGDVGKADVDVNDESARHALQVGVKYSNGNRAIRHMGVPTVSVTMGLMERSKMPVNLTFAGKHGQDTDLLKYAYDFEQFARRRIAPPLTPALVSDEILAHSTPATNTDTRPLSLDVLHSGRTGDDEVLLSILVIGSSKEDEIKVEAFANGKAIPASQIEKTPSEWTIRATYTPFDPPKPLYGGLGKVAGHVVMVVLARRGNCVAGKLVLISQKAPIRHGG